MKGKFNSLLLNLCEIALCTPCCTFHTVGRVIALFFCREPVTDEFCLMHCSSLWREDGLFFSSLLIFSLHTCVHFCKHLSHSLLSQDEELACLVPPFTEASLGLLSSLLSSLYLFHVYFISFVINN